MDTEELITKKVMYADREKILEDLLAVAAECSTWISECSLTPEDKEAAVVCLAEISGAVRLVKKLLNWGDELLLSDM